MPGLVTPRWLLLTSAVTLACTADPVPDDDGGGTTSTSSMTTSTTSPGDNTGTTNPGTGSGTTNPGTTMVDPSTGTTMMVDPTIDPPLLDVGSIPDSPAPEMGCTKVDFMFVIDNSGSMGAQQAQLLASFDGFITAIEAALEGVVDSYHVGVITSDAYSANEPGCTTIGDLVTQTSAGGNCAPFAEGNRFATEQDDLMTKFPCMANVGSFGSPIEQPVTGTIASFDPSKTGPGGCNEGFLRDDAILVLVIVTDDPPYNFDMDDAHPATITTDWHDDVIAAKNDDEEALVVIGFIPWDDLGCVFGGESPNLIGFIDSFGEQGVKASICEPDFGPIFADTVSTIVETCQNFMPPQG